MGLGIVKKGRHQPITPYAGSWAEQQAKSGPVDWLSELKGTQPRRIREPDLTLKPSQHRKGNE